MVATQSLLRRRTQLSKAWAQRVAGGPGATTAGVREAITSSWDRSRATVPLDLTAAPMTDADEVADTWRSSPLRQAVARLEPQLAATARDADLVLAITDPNARILWTSAGRLMRTRAESVGFAPGGRWDEASVGTNALDLAARTGATSTVWSAEHFAPIVQGWVCWAAPILAPGSGALLGVVDLSTTWDRAQPLGPTTASALALLLADALPAPTAAPAPEQLRLLLLGAGTASRGATRLPLTRRQVEILAVLALHPDGLSLPALHAAVYGDARVSTSTLKAEVSHLRTVLHGGIASRPYRLEVPVRSDVDDVLDAVRAGDVTTAVHACRGALLEGTESPALRQAGCYVEVAVREALLARPDAEAVLAYAQRFPDDAELFAVALAAVPPTAPQHALLAARLRASQE